MFHHCQNFHATPANVTDRQRRAHVMIFMADGVRVKLDQAPTHPLIPNFTVGDGEETGGRRFSAFRAGERSLKVEDAGSVCGIGEFIDHATAA